MKVSKSYKLSEFLDWTRRRLYVVLMLTIYPKNVAENIPAHVLRQIRKEVDDG